MAAEVINHQIPDEWNALTGKIIGAAMEVHSQLGPGLRESFYEQALIHELRAAGLRVDRQVPFRIHYKGADLGIQFVDTVVEELVILENKATEKVLERDLAQLVGYLRFTGLPLGLLINFNVAHLKQGIFRRVNWPARPHPASLVIESKQLSVPSVRTQ